VKETTTVTNQIKTIVLMGSLAALVLGLGALVAPGHLYLFGFVALAMNLGAYFFSDRLVLRMHGAREVSPAEALIPERQPNAFATGRNPRHGVVAVTVGLLETLDRRELRGVLAHELAHIRNRDILISSIAAAGAAVITYVAHAVTFAGLMGGSSRDDDSEGDTAGGLLAALVTPLAATLVQLGISRSREYLADETGARISGDPEALASALLALDHAASRVPARVTPATASLFIVNPLGALSTMAGWFATHPSTADRVRRLREMAVGGVPDVRNVRGRVLARGW
jgi:heat shock protein HtpX